MKKPTWFPFEGQIALGLTLLFVCSEGVSAPVGTHQPTVGDRTILGITLGSSTAQDVARILGFVPAREARNPEITKVCYVGKDMTVLEFVNWFDPVEFRLFRAPPKMKLPCARSTLVSQNLATASGLKLGIYMAEVTGLLGLPSRTDKRHLVYEFSTERPLTSKEAALLKEKGGPPWEVQSVDIYDKIEITLQDSRVVSIKILHSETD